MSEMLWMSLPVSPEATLFFFHLLLLLLSFYDLFYYALPPPSPLLSDLLFFSTCPFLFHLYTHPFLLLTNS